MKINYVCLIPLTTLGTSIYFFGQGSEMIYLVFVDHLLCIKNSDGNGKEREGADL